MTPHAKSTSTEHPPTESLATSDAPGDTAGMPTAHALRVEEVLQRLAVVPEQGLSRDGAESRLAEFGPNQLPEPERDSAFIRFFRHFQDVLIYVLIGAGILTAVLQHWADTIVIALVVVINALVGFLQEGRSERALAGIRSMLSPSADVLRAGNRIAWLMVGLLTLLQVAFVYAPPMHAVFDTTLLSPFYLLITVTAGVMVFLLTELLKLLLSAVWRPHES